MIPLIWIKFPNHIPPKQSGIITDLPPNFIVGAIHDSLAISLNRQRYFCFVFIPRRIAPFSTHWHSNFYVCLPTATFWFYYHIYEWLLDSHSAIKGSAFVLQLLEILCFLWKSLNQPAILVLFTIYAFCNVSPKFTTENSLCFWLNIFSPYSQQFSLSFLENIAHRICIFSIIYIH